MSGRCYLFECDPGNKANVVEKLKNNSYSKTYIVSTNGEEFPKALKHLKNHVKAWQDEYKVDMTQNALIILDVDASGLTEKEWNKLINDIPLFKIDLKGITDNMNELPQWIIKKYPFISKVS